MRNKSNRNNGIILIAYNWYLTKVRGEQVVG